MHSSEYLNQLKIKLLLSIIILTSCGSTKQVNMINKIDRIVMNIDNQAELKTDTFDLRDYIKTQKGIFSISQLNGEIKRITIILVEHNNKMLTTIYLDKNLPVFIRQHQTLTIVAETVDFNILTSDHEYHTDFYIMDWDNEIYKAHTPDSMQKIENQYTFKKEQVDRMISIANSLKR